MYQSVQKLFYLKNFIVFCIFSLVVTSHCMAGYYSTLETAEIVNEGDYKVNASAYWNEGFGFAGYFEAPFSSNSSWRAGLGKGKGYLHIDGGWKWIPIPDYEKQPAIGSIFGISYLYYSADPSGSLLVLSAHPIISKKITISSIEIVPYTGLFLGVALGRGNGLSIPVRWTIGSEISSPHYLENWSMILELSLRLRHTANVFSIGVSYLI